MKIKAVLFPYMRMCILLDILAEAKFAKNMAVLIHVNMHLLYYSSLNFYKKEVQ